MTNDKYEIDKSDNIQGTGMLLFRLKAKRDIETIVGLVPKGSLGGYVVDFNSVGWDDNSWCFSTGVVDNSGSVKGNAVVMSGGLETSMEGDTVLDELNLLQVEKGGRLENVKSEDKAKVSPKPKSNVKTKVGLKRSK